MSLLSRSSRWKSLDQKFYPVGAEPMEWRVFHAVGEDRETPIHAFGLCVPPLVVHVVYGTFENEVAFRVTHEATGGAIADFTSLESAVGFSQSVRSLDWSGDVGSIIERNRREVIGAARIWRSVDDGSAGGAS